MLPDIFLKVTEARELLEKLCGVRGRRAFATCVCVILPLCAVSATIYALRAGIDLAATAPYLAGGLAGGALAGRLLPRVPVKWLRLLLAGFMLYGGARALLWS